MEAKMPEESDFPKVEKIDKSMIEVNPGWPFWQRAAANVINASGVIGWIIAVYVIIMTYNKSAVLVSYRDAYLNLVVPASVIGILSLIAGLTLVSWLFPYFSFRTMMEKGTPIERASCMGFWATIAIALSIIISGAR
jgi:hypothetical protein